MAACNPTVIILTSYQGSFSGRPRARVLPPTPLHWEISPIGTKSRQVSILRVRWTLGNGSRGLEKSRCEWQVDCCLATCTAKPTPTRREILQSAMQMPWQHVLHFPRFHCAHACGTCLAGAEPNGPNHPRGSPEIGQKELTLAAASV